MVDLEHIDCVDHRMTYSFHGWNNSIFLQSCSSCMKKKKVWCILLKEASSILDVQVLGCVVNCFWIGSFKCLDLHIELIVKHILFYLHTIINVCKECTIFIDKNHLYANTFSWITIKSLNHCYYFPISIVNSILVILLVYTFIHIYILHHPYCYILYFLGFLRSKNL